MHNARSSKRFRSACNNEKGETKITKVKPMKSISKITLAMAVCTLSAILATSAAASNPKSVHDIHFTTEPPTADPVYDVNGNPAVNPDTLLYGNSSGLCDHMYPITAPDG